MSQLSSHIPDMDLITFYSEKNTSVSSKVSPWTKALFLLIIIVFVATEKSLVLNVCLFLAVLAIYALSGLPVKKLFQWYTMPLVFVLSLVVFLMWNEPGRALFTVRESFLTLTLTDSGVLLVFTLIFKSLATVTYSLFFLMTTRYNYFSTMIYRVFPSPIDQIFLMSYRFIFITLNMVDSMMKALKSRGGGLLKSALMQSKMFAELFALTLIRSYDRSERVNKAMEARGFSGKYIASTRVPGISAVECAALMTTAILVSYLLWFVKVPF